MKELKKMFEDAHHWVGRQSVIVQIGIIFFALFVVIACLIGIGT